MCASLATEESGTFSHVIKIARGQGLLKDCCTSLPFAGDSVSVPSLKYKQAPYTPTSIHCTV